VRPLLNLRTSLALSNKIEFLDCRQVIKPRYNAAPTDDLPVYRVNRERGAGLITLRWGLIPSWATDAKIGARLINARCETVDTLPAFSNAFQLRHCLIPASGFFEWPKNALPKLPLCYRLLNEELFAFAGLYEWWPNNGSEPIETYTIITTTANELVGEIHDRMPVILPAERYEAWLDADNQNIDELKMLLQPYPADEMQVHLVDPKVGNVKNDEPSLVEPFPNSA